MFMLVFPCCVSSCGCFMCMLDFEEWICSWSAFHFVFTLPSTWFLRGLYFAILHNIPFSDIIHTTVLYRVANDFIQFNTIIALRHNMRCRPFQEMDIGRDKLGCIPAEMIPNLIAAPRRARMPSQTSTMGYPVTESE